MKNLENKSIAARRASTTPDDSYNGDQYRNPFQEQEAEIDELKHRHQSEKVQAETLAAREAEIQALTNELQQARAALATMTGDHKSKSTQSSPFSTRNHTPTSSQQSDNSTLSWFVINSDQPEEPSTVKEAKKANKAKKAGDINRSSPPKYPVPHKPAGSSLLFPNLT
ncbi:hypothetical protein PG993_010273 [Apiospora rasikravindrae]|uniref:Uncharacterized protein n=1 Tax=Apiospora rasikravindrae TaxID=990691 RepID=A0ABR1SLR5_9PEZI